MVWPNVASLMHTAVMFANDVESPPWGTSSSLRWRRCRCWWYLPWTHLRGDAKVVIIAQVQRRHGDRTVHPLTWSGVSGGSVSLLNIQPCCFFFNPQLSHHLQRPLPSSAVQMSASPPKNESINLSFYPSLLSPLVFVFQAIIFPRSSLIWFQSLSVSEAGEPKRNPDSFEATISLPAESSLYSKMLRFKVRLSGRLNRGHLLT